MKFAASNIALTAYNHSEELMRLPDMGLIGLEVAPSRVWQDSWAGLTPRAVETYRGEIEQAGLKVVGLHSLFYDQPELGLFRDGDARARTLDFMEHLSKLCRDLGGRTLIYGGGRWRRELPLEDAFAEAVEFFAELIPRIQSHGTIYCFEPLGPTGSDFINSVLESISIVESLDHPSLRVQLDAKALAETGEMKAEIFKAAQPYLVHVHTNEPDMGILGTSGDIDNHLMAHLLKDIGYDQYISIEQKMIGEDAPLEALKQSAKILTECYG
jgi:sugar phosphate isomerase/epimerase